MAKRKSIRKYPTDEVQGEGSFVIISGVKVREIREVRKKALDPEVDEFEEGLKLLAKHIVKWDWVDDEGNPLPLPKEQPTVVDELTNEESTFLVNLLMGEGKN